MAIGIIDMNGAVSWDVIREALSRADGDVVPTLAFGPHVDIEGRREAVGRVTRIVSNGQFHSDMAALMIVTVAIQTRNNRWHVRKVEQQNVLE